MLTSLTTRTSATFFTRSSSLSQLSHHVSPTSSLLTPIRLMSTKGGGREVRMRVLLKEDDSRLGLKGDEVVVKRGYGRNVLVGKGKAVYATEENKRIFAERAAREKAEKAAAAGAEAEAAAAASSAAESSDAAASVAAPSAGSDEESFRYTLELTRRLASLRPMVFLRETQGREQTVKQAITPMDVYQRLVKQFPSLLRSQIKFLSDAQALGKVGEVTAEVSGFGTFKPVTFKVQLKRSVKGQVAAVAPTKDATPAATTAASAADKAKAASIRA